MTPTEYSSVLQTLKDSLNLNPYVDIVTFCTRDYAMRGVLYDALGSPELVLLIECIDAFDTSGAGNDFVAVPLSELVHIKHDAKKARYERNKMAEIAKAQLKGV